MRSAFFFLRLGFQIHRVEEQGKKMAPSVTSTTPPVVLALALASALYLLLALVKFLARAVPRFVENAKAVPRLSIDLDDGKREREREDCFFEAFFWRCCWFLIDLLFLQGDRGAHS